MAIYSYSTKTKSEERKHIVKIVGENVDVKIRCTPEYTIPKNLCKYYRCDVYSLRVLKQQQIFASHRSNFNDPFDSSVLFWEGKDFPFSSARDHLKKLAFSIQNVSNLSELIELCKNNNQMRELYFNTFSEFFGIYCLNDGSHEDLFWGYYNNHEGYRIKFKADILNSYWKLEPMKVEYLGDNELLKQKLVLADTDFGEQIYPKLIRWMTVKKDYWDRENEWRYIFRTKLFDLESRKKKFPVQAIESIALGYKFFKDAKHDYQKDGVSKYVFKIKGDCGNSQKNFNLEILKFLKNHSNFPVYQVALDENLKLYHQRIFIKEVFEDTVMVLREFPPEQLKAMDAKPN